MRVIFCFLLCLNLSIKAQPTSSLLWEISGNGLQAPSYLFGSFHLMCANDFQFHDIIKEKINKTKQFYAEVDLWAPNLQQEMMTLMLLPNTNLEKLIGEKEFPRVDSLFTQITGMSLKTITPFKPFMASSILTLKSITCADQVQPETKLMEYAKASNSSIKGLETIRDQINAIDTEPLDSQVSALKQAIIQFDSVKLMMKSLISIYKKKNPDSLYSFIKDNSRSDKFETALIIKRNKNWIPIITEAIKKIPSFFVVGAGHLGGETGVITLLRKEGYIVKPIAY
jgi:uncharacterized protein YbaP (TraB family)